MQGLLTSACRRRSRLTCLGAFGRFAPSLGCLMSPSPSHVHRCRFAPRSRSLRACVSTSRNYARLRLGSSHIRVVIDFPNPRIFCSLCSLHILRARPTAASGRCPYVLPSAGLGTCIPYMFPNHFPNGRVMNPLRSHLSALDKQVCTFGKSSSVASRAHGEGYDL